MIHLKPNELVDTEGEGKGGMNREVASTSRHCCCCWWLGGSVTQLCVILLPMDGRLPVSSAHGLPRQEYWRGLAFPSPIYTLLCVRQIAGEKLLYNTGSPAWCSVMT